MSGCQDPEKTEEEPKAKVPARKPPTKRHRCTTCSKAFSWQYMLVRHLKIHEKIRHFRCTWPNCSKVFRRQCNLETHERLHRGELPWKCPAVEFHCAAAFPSKAHLCSHLRMHGGNAPFKCVHCQKNFKTRVYFIKHMRIKHHW